VGLSMAVVWGQLPSGWVTANAARARSEGEARIAGEPLGHVVGEVCRHSAFGLLWSSNALLIPELPTAAPPTGAELEGEIAITSEDPLTWPQLPPGPHNTPFLQMARGDLRLTVEGIGRFRITDGERIAWQRADAGVSDQDIRTFLLGSAVGALLR
jgi:hypothetical protein